MRDYVAHLRDVAQGRPTLLPAHVYVRYLGDLSGGQLLSGAVRRALGLADEAGMAFYAFGSAHDIAALKQDLRAGLDGLPLSDDEGAAVVAEAQEAFGRHARLFEELAASN